MYGKTFLAKCGRCMGKCRYSFKYSELRNWMGSVVIFIAWPLYPWGNSPFYLLSRRLGESQAGLDNLEKGISPVCSGNQTMIFRSFGPLLGQIYFNMAVMAESDRCFIHSVKKDSVFV
jgi:hypothetical protein